MRAGLLGGLHGKLGLAHQRLGDRFERLGAGGVQASADRKKGEHESIYTA
jgi:hypothetical protein